MPPPSDADFQKGVQSAAKMIASNGITTSTEITLGAVLGLDREVKLLDILPRLKARESSCETLMPERKNVPGCIEVTVIDRTTI